MSLSRRGFFRGLFGAGAAAVLAPVVKLMGAPTPFYGGNEMNFPIIFKPKEYFASVDLADPITVQILQDAFAQAKFPYPPPVMYINNTEIVRDMGEFMAADKES